MNEAVPCDHINTTDVNFPKNFSGVKNFNSRELDLDRYLSSADTNSNKKLQWVLHGAGYAYGHGDE